MHSLKRTLLLLACVTATATISAQTLEQAKSMYQTGAFEQAKPVFAKYLKSQPNNANYNFWYGACCVETNDIEKSLKPLEFAKSRKVQNAYFYLAKAYNKLYRFDDAVVCYEDFISFFEKKRVDLSRAETELERARTDARMLKGVEEVCFIDSFVVDKSSFLDHYHLSSESGKISQQEESFIYETEMGHKSFFSQKDTQGVFNIYTRNKTFGQWEKGVVLPNEINASGNTSYPYVLMDGVTIYYASDGKESMGGYDIFVTRYNSATDSYLTPESVGMPFNSPYNDYMYAIDEFNNLGWFASDRFQPEGKVCIYVFIPNSSKKTYNYESMKPEEAAAFAQIASIKATWKDAKEVQAAQKRLKTIMNVQPVAKQKVDFTFVVNDYKEYHTLSDFESPRAKTLFQSYQQQDKDFASLKQKLASLREQYGKGNNGVKEKLSPSILDLENRLQEMNKERLQLEMNIRKEELNFHP